MKNEIKGFKGFNKDMTCRGFQFKKGETYEHKGSVEICRSGFHFCENPIDVLAYYNPAKSVFCEVVGSGSIDKRKDDSKVVASKIEISAKLELKMFVDSAIKYMVGRKYKKRKSSSLKEDYSCASNSGDSSMASNSGYSSMASNSGDSSMASNSGYSSMAINSGDSSMASNSGYSSMASNSGYRSMASNSGDRSMASNSGDSSMASNSGDRSMASNSGDSSVSACSGLHSKACAGIYGAIVLAWYNEKEDRIEIKCGEIGCGDGSDGKLKAGVFYHVNDAGEFIEVAE
jgi:hypothetical protein